MQAPMSSVQDEPSHTGRWLAHEYDLFVECKSSPYQDYEVYGKNWKAISEKIKSRTPEQVRSHAQKYLAKKLRKEKEEQEVQEAKAMIPDELEKRFTRKKVKRINYREREVYPDSFLL